METANKLKLADEPGFVSKLNNLYLAEKELAAALTKMSVAVTSPNLAAAFNRHQKATHLHEIRVEGLLFNGTELRPAETGHHSLSPFIKEGEQIIANQARSHAKDAALLDLARRVEQHEMALYADLIEQARRIGIDEVLVNVLTETWLDEKDTDITLALLAEELVYPALSRETGTVPATSSASR